MVCPQIFSSFHSCAVVSVWDVIARSLGFFQRILPKSSSNKVQLFFSSELVLGGFLGFHGWWKKQDEAPGAGIPEITGVGNLPSGAGDAFSWRLVGLCGNHVLLQSFVSSWGLSTAASCPGFPLFHNSWMASAPRHKVRGRNPWKSLPVVIIHIWFLRMTNQIQTLFCACLLGCHENELPFPFGGRFMKRSFYDPHRTHVVKENLIPGTFRVKKCTLSCLCDEGSRIWSGNGCSELQGLSPGLVPQCQGEHWEHQHCAGQNPCCRQRCLPKASPLQPGKGLAQELEVSCCFCTFLFSVPYSLCSSPPSPWDVNAVKDFSVFGNKKLCSQLLCASLQITTSASLILRFPSSEVLSELIFSVEFGSAGSRMSLSGQPGEEEVAGFCLLHSGADWGFCHPQSPPGSDWQDGIVLCSAPLHLCVPPLVMFSNIKHQY